MLMGIGELADVWTPLRLRVEVEINTGTCAYSIFRFEFPYAQPWHGRERSTEMGAKIDWMPPEEIFRRERNSDDGLWSRQAELHRWKWRQVPLLNFDEVQPGRLRPLHDGFDWNKSRTTTLANLHVFAMRLLVQSILCNFLLDNG